jgi:purine-binding chemotaxis protein CheW
MSSGELPDPIVELCAFRVGSQEYVVDLRRIREVVKPLEILSVPGAPTFVEGVVDLRGEVIPVVDVRRRFGLPAASHGRQAKFLVVRVGQSVLALVVDAVREVVRIPRSAIRPVPPAPRREGPRLFLGACGGEGGEPVGRGPGRAAGGSPGRGANRPRLRLLLNVKALLGPIGPEAVAAAREMVGAAEGGP